MPVNIRLLHPDEYHRLADHPSLGGLQLPSPDLAKIIIAEDGDTIVGYWSLIQVVHMEPIWIDPKYRGSTLAGRLWSAMCQVLDALQITVAYSFSASTEISGYLARLGLRPLPWQVFVYDPLHRHPDPDTAPKG
jgi:hypothetical protein